MWHLTACKISVSLSFLNWIKNETIFYHISELMLATLQVIQRYDKKIIFDCINTIYQFIKLFLDNKMSIFEGYGAFKEYLVIIIIMGEFSPFLHKTYVVGTH